MQKSVKYALAAVVLVIVVGGAGFYWFVLRDTAPGKASLQAGQTTATAPDRATADGSWKVAPATNVFVGYRVQELFAGDSIQKTAVGRTTAVTGTMKVSGSTVESVSISADVHASCTATRARVTVSSATRVSRRRSSRRRPSS